MQYSHMPHSRGGGVMQPRQVYQQRGLFSPSSGIRNPPSGPVHQTIHPHAPIKTGHHTSEHVISFVKDASTFFLRQMDELEDFHKHQVELQDFYNNKEGSATKFDPKVQFFRGNFIAVRNEDMTWHRARVLDSDMKSGGVRISFLDTGPEEVVPWDTDRAKPLHPVYLAYPAYAIECCLHLVSESGKKSWSLEEAESFKQLLERFVPNSVASVMMSGVTDTGKCMVDILNGCGQSVASAFVQELTGIHKPEHKSFLPSSPRLPQVPNRGSLAPRGSTAPPSAMVYTRMTDGGHPYGVPPPPPSSPQAPKMERRRYLPRSNAAAPSYMKYMRIEPRDFLHTQRDVTMSLVKSPDDFYVTIKDRGMDDVLLRSITDMTAFYSTLPPDFMPLTNLEAGQPCAAQFKSDCQWYRATVVDGQLRSGNTIRVRFVDFGNEENVLMANLRQLRETDFQYPVLAIHCCLQDAFPVSGPQWSPEAFRYMENLLDKRLVCVFHKIRDGDGAYEVELLNVNVDEETPVSVLGVMKMKRLAASDPAHLSPSEPCFRKTKEPLGSSVGATGCWVESLSHFYIMLRRSQKDLDEISRLLASAYSGERGQRLHPPVSMGSMCVARYKDDGNWYRAEIVSNAVNLPNTYRIRFVDFGDTALCPGKELRAIQSGVLSETPALALCCKLNGAETVGMDLMEFKREISKLVRVKLLSQDEFGKYTVDITVEGRNILDKMKERSSKIRFIPGPSSSQGHILRPGKCLREEQEEERKPSESQLKVSGLPDLRIPGEEGDYMDVVVSYVQDPDVVYVQLQNEKKAILDLSMILRTEFAQEKGPLTPFVNPRKGELCASKYSEDNQWYRAVVRDRPDSRNINVYFVDYGNTELVDKNSIVKIENDKLASYPPQAIRCKLTNIPTGCNVTKFRGFLLSKSVAVRLDKDTSDGFEVTMEYVQGKDIYNVNDIIAGKRAPPSSNRATGNGYSQGQQRDGEVGGGTRSFERGGGRQSHREGGREISDQGRGRYGGRGNDEPGFVGRDGGDRAGNLVISRNVYGGGSFRGRDSGGARDGGITGRGRFGDNRGGSFGNRGSGSGFVGNREEAGFGGRSEGGGEFRGGRGGSFRGDRGGLGARGGGSFGERNNDSGFSGNNFGRSKSRDDSRGGSFGGGFGRSSSSEDTKSSGGIGSGKIGFGGGNFANAGKIVEQDTTDSSKKTAEKKSETLPVAIVDKKKKSKEKVKTVSLTDRSIEMNKDLPAQVQFSEYGPGKFFLMPLSWKPALEAVEDALGKVGDRKISMESVAEGTEGLSVFDGVEYRCRVVSVKGEKATVIFYDWGNTETVPINTVYAVPEDLVSDLSLPPLAVECRLNGVMPVSEDNQWGKDATSAFVDKIGTGDSVTAKFVGKDSETRAHLVSVTTSDGRNISNFLIEKCLGSRTEETSAITEGKLAQESEKLEASSIEMNRDLPAQVQFSEYGPGNFFLMPISWKPALEAVEDALGKVGDRKISMESVAEGTEGLSVFDNVEYRCKVVSVEGEKATVIFYDWGNTETVPINTVYAVPEDLVADLSLPALAVECRLEGIKPVSGDEFCSDARSAFAEKLDIGDPVTVKFSQQDSDTKARSVAVTTADGLDIAGFLIGKGYGSSVEELTVGLKEISKNVEEGDGEAKEEESELEKIPAVDSGPGDASNVNGSGQCTTVEEDMPEIETNEEKSDEERSLPVESADVPEEVNEEDSTGTEREKPGLLKMDALESEIVPEEEVTQEFSEGSKLDTESVDGDGDDSTPTEDPDDPSQFLVGAEGFKFSRMFGEEPKRKKSASGKVSESSDELTPKQKEGGPDGDGKAIKGANLAEEEPE